VIDTPIDITPALDNAPRVAARLTIPRVEHGNTQFDPIVASNCTLTSHCASDGIACRAAHFDADCQSDALPPPVRSRHQVQWLNGPHLATKVQSELIASDR
jgi:hypothetical protein